MVSDNDENSSHSPTPRDRYKRYKSDSTVPIPLRTLNRWRSKGFFSSDDRSRNDSDLGASSISENNFTADINNTMNDPNISLSDVSDVDSVSSMSTDENESLESNSDHDNEEINDNDDHYSVNYEEDDNIEYDYNIDDMQAIGNENTAESNMLLTNSTINVDKFVLDLLNLYIKHNITKAALQDILKIQLKFLPDNNEIPKTLYKLFQYAKDIAPPCKFIKTYYCKRCLFNVDLEIIAKKQVKKCSLCQTDQSSDIGFFHKFDVSDQIKFLFEHNNLAEKLKCTRPQNPGSISDITDGAEYIRVNTRCNKDPYDLTIVLNTDGLSLVKSAKSHCWPVMFTIAELPEDIRDKFIIIIGLWYDDSCKPCMNLFLKPIFDQLKECFVTGVDWVNPKTGMVMNSKIVAPLIIADAPARAQIQNIMSFNGRYGCNICEIRMVKSKRIAELRTSRIFPYKIDCKIRTGKRMEAQAKQLLKKNSVNQIRGVKGYSAASCLPLIDLGTCFIPEFMHSVLLGVVKQIIGLWFINKKPWSLKEKTKEIDEFILRIRPPQSFSRLPRKLSQYTLFKASEFYNFLLFYSIPLLSVYLPIIYFEHWLLLVKAIFNLVKSMITQAELEEADSLLKMFVSQVEALYGDRQLSYNVHQLLHLALCVKRWGPLQGTSAFAFENHNGYIAKCVHGSKHFGQEIVNNLQILQGTKLIENRINEWTANNNVTTNNSRNYGVLGKMIQDVKIKDLEHDILLSNHIELKSMSVYARVKINNEIYTSEIYKTTKTNSHTVQIDLNGSLIYGSIKYFFLFQDNLYIIINQFTVDHTKIFYHIKTKSIIEHIIPIKESDRRMLINYSNVKILTQLIRVENYVCKKPNTLKTVW
ncbi:uncharacterized protein LOC130666535 [Microplitis mediator]|uniref:uncharacterized protein LOC130666535 n=1 Tax=Microplitis mediator TaxID=375433 RepID=UPI0025538D36|nr:uncharacterized protein LOC130666535 [Microplitis mediator]